MNRQRKELLKSIIEMEKKVRIAKLNEMQHKCYFDNLFKRNQYLLAATLVPAFVSGWQGGKLARGGKKIKQIGKYGLMTLFNLLGKYRKFY